MPASLQESAPAVGAARTEIKPPVSEYASALEGIAGEPVAHDPSTKYGPALGSLTGDAPAQGTGTGVVGAVTSAAGSVVQTVKHVCSSISLSAMHHRADSICMLLACMPDMQTCVTARR